MSLKTQLLWTARTNIINSTTSNLESLTTLHRTAYQMALWLKSKHLYSHCINQWQFDITNSC